MICCKGIGHDHAKFSPVCTASYKLKPYVKILKPVYGDLALKLKESLAPGVIEIKENETNGQAEAYVANESLDNGSRNYFRYPELKDCIEVGRIANNFI
ncbi:MAG: DNA-directed RNA polymerases I and III subunit RPAC1, partial [Paramarteilia canceri]